MSNIRKTYLVVLFLLVSILLTGCFWQQTTAEKMYDILENVANAEDEFQKQQDPLVTLEKNEKELYSKIISLGSKEQNQIIKLADEAIEVVGKRKEHMQKEQDSLIASKKEFEKIKPLINELDEEKPKKSAIELEKIMNERYQIHDEMYKQYLLGIDYDIELYKLLKNKDVEIEKLDGQISKINETYKKVLEANEKFNELTKKYNKAKLVFYKDAGLNVTRK